jgi:hypothetical protein
MSIEALTTVAPPPQAPFETFDGPWDGLEPALDALPLSPPIVLFEPWEPTTDNPR